ncbi:hypothetical protein IC800_17875 [Acinetobacter seifertii]|uniref:hypothetical protein n=1 Tax=Acinetobacter seifertii TaxID=1530123 RepID=UPI00168D1717|nr:hypothetical protein [Acinetobacter seifertii]QNW94720.1 hypothetical protein IC800_17875 [Acinetobacter seifertii]QNX01787.1 hypothetical protein IC798_18005 [Acinetobacter seifertii]
MFSLDKLFDKYSFNARVKPALFIILPVVVTAYILIEPLRTLLGSLVGIFVTCGVVNFFANQMSSVGNELQIKLFKKWGGAPTTIILRYSDESLDKYTKQRYRAKLNKLIPNFKKITESYEMQHPNDADDYYNSASSFMREYTRNVEKYSLIFSENIAYGFSRNLLAFKKTAITVVVISFLISITFIFLNISIGLGSINELKKIPSSYYVLLAIHIIFLLIWIFMINEKWVKIRGIAYAKRLYAACEDIQ